jgi:ribosomal protein S18 acetylase RimI-like enzyme
MVVTMRRGVPDDAALLHDLAARTFPLACPPGTAQADIDAFVQEHLSRSSFDSYLKDGNRIVLIATVDGRPAGYSMLIAEPGADPEVRAAIGSGDDTVVELSKFYVAAESHGSGLADALMRGTIDGAAATGARLCWLGVNRQNRRAARFYARHGFEVAGVKRFRLGDDWQDDDVMVRRLT